jgi:hypothetical protein
MGFDERCRRARLSPVAAHGHEARRHNRTRKQLTNSNYQQSRNAERAAIACNTHVSYAYGRFAKRRDEPMTVHN